MDIIVDNREKVKLITKIMCIIVGIMLLIFIVTNILKEGSGSYPDVEIIKKGTEKYIKEFYEVIMKKELIGHGNGYYDNVYVYSVSCEADTYKNGSSDSYGRKTYTCSVTGQQTYNGAYYPITSKIDTDVFVGVMKGIDEIVYSNMRDLDMICYGKPRSEGLNCGNVWSTTRYSIESIQNYK